MKRSNTELTIENRPGGREVLPGMDRHAKTAKPSVKSRRLTAKPEPATLESGFLEGSDQEQLARIPRLQEHLVQAARSVLANEFRLDANSEELEGIRLRAEAQLPGDRQQAQPQSAADEAAAALPAVDRKPTTRGRPPGVSTGVKVDRAKLKILRGTMSQADFAAKCKDVSEDTVQRAESGMPISPAKLKSIAEALSIIHNKPISAVDLIDENTAIK